MRLRITPRNSGLENQGAAPFHSNHVKRNQESHRAVGCRTETPSGDDVRRNVTNEHDPLERRSIGNYSDDESRQRVANTNRQPWKWKQRKSRALQTLCNQGRELQDPEEWQKAAH